MGEFVRLEVADGIGTIRLDRPKMNALNLQVQNEIEECAREATVRDDVAAVIVYGGERVFAAGADIKEMQTMSYTDMAVAVEGLHSFTTTLARIPKPSVWSLVDTTPGCSALTATPGSRRCSSIVNSALASLDCAYA